MYESLDDLIKPEHLVFLAAAVQAAALLFQGQTRIRIVLLVGSMIYLIYYMTAAEEPLWEAIIATMAMAVANIYGLTARLLGNTVRLIPANQVSLFSMIGEVEPGEFRALMRHGRIRKLGDDEQLTTVGKIPERLFYVIEGKIEIEQGQGRFLIPPRHFIGEVSLMLGTPASATAHVKAGAQLVEWPREQLLAAMDQEPKLMVAVESLLGRDMARKVALGAGFIDSKYVNVDPTVDFLI